MKLSWDIIQKVPGMLELLIEYMNKRSQIHPKISNAVISPVYLDAPCLIWIGSKQHGYGCVSITSEELFPGITYKRYAHILAYIIANQKEPKKKVIHTCGRGLCVERTHLKEEEYKGENQDHYLMMKTNQNPYSKGGSKLTYNEAQTVLFLHQKYNWSAKEIHEHFSHVHLKSIYSILSGKTWSRVLKSKPFYQPYKPMKG
jgi:hypothetical protein